MSSTVLDTRKFRDALGSYASGITIISAVVDGAPLGFTCQSFYSVSLEPPLVSFSVMRSSSRWPKIHDAGKFAINVLSSRQAQISSTLGRSSPDAWEKIEWSPSVEGNPFLAGALLSIDCSIFDVHSAGDHVIVVAKVENLHEGHDEVTAGPLLFYKGQYHSLTA